MFSKTNPCGSNTNILGDNSSPPTIHKGGGHNWILFAIEHVLKAITKRICAQHFRWNNGPKSRLNRSWILWEHDMRSIFSKWINKQWLDCCKSRRNSKFSKDTYWKMYGSELATWISSTTFPQIPTNNSLPFVKLVSPSTMETQYPFLWDPW